MDQMLHRCAQSGNLRSSLQNRDEEFVGQHEEGDSRSLWALSIETSVLTHACHRWRHDFLSKGEAEIMIDPLPSIQFESYLAHECAHHVHFFLGKTNEEAWLREG